MPLPTATPDRRSRAEWVSWLACSVPECLVFATVSDDETERIGQQHLVGHFIAEAVNDIRRPPFAVLFVDIAGRAEDFVELDLGAIGRLAQVFQDNRVDFDVDVRL